MPRLRNGLAILHASHLDREQAMMRATSPQHRAEIRRRRPAVTNWDTPSARERQLARELRRLRAAVGLNGREAADRLGWSASKVSRIETSRTGVSTPDLEQLLALYGADDDRAAYLRKLAPSARSKAGGTPTPTHCPPATQPSSGWSPDREPYSATAR